jgi:hypothetical protein
MGPSSPWYIVATPESLNGFERDVLEIDSGIRSKNQLISFVTREWRFPYHSPTPNWDSFEESINDLSWLTKPVCLYHWEVPPLESEEDNRTYMSILETAVVRWSQKPIQRLYVAFSIEPFADQNDKLD